MTGWGAGALVLAGVLVTPQSQAAPGSLQTTLTELGSLDLGTRTRAAQTVRRLPAATAIPLLSEAVRANADGYVRYEALVLLSDFGPEAVEPTMRQVLTDKNDRLRAVAYGWFTHHPAPSVTPALVAALSTEESEFVRPALTRAIAASNDEATIRASLVPLVSRGVNFFRAGVIEALGDYHVKSAVAPILEVAKQDGPLRDNAIEALGKIGDRSVLSFLVSLQSTVPADLQPAVAAAVCQLGTDCDAQITFLVDTLAAGGSDQTRAPITEAASHALAVLAVGGEPKALAALLDAGEPAKEPARSPLALATGYVALRQPSALLAAVETRAARPPVLLLLRDAFDMLSDEDFERECFYAEVRSLFWGAADGSPERQTAQALITALEF